MKYYFRNYEVRGPGPSHIECKLFKIVWVDWKKSKKQFQLVYLRIWKWVFNV